MTLRECFSFINYCDQCSLICRLFPIDSFWYCVSSLQPLSVLHLLSFYFVIQSAMLLLLVWLHLYWDYYKYSQPPSFLFRNFFVSSSFLTSEASKLILFAEQSLACKHQIWMSFIQDFAYVIIYIKQQMILVLIST